MADRVASPTRGRRLASAPSENGGGGASEALVPLLCDYLDDVATRTAHQLDVSGGVAVTVEVGDQPLTVGASNELASDVDAIQYSVGFGPCLRALYAAEVDGIDESQRDLAASVAVDIAGGIRLARHLTAQAQTIDDRESAMDSGEPSTWRWGCSWSDSSAAPTMPSRTSQPYKDLLQAVGTEEISHVELIGTTIARLLDGSPGYQGKKTDPIDEPGAKGCDSTEDRPRHQQHPPLSRRRPRRAARRCCGQPMAGFVRLQQREPDSRPVVQP
jgi:hypothetical protein